MYVPRVRANAYHVLTTPPRVFGDPKMCLRNIWTAPNLECRDCVFRGPPQPLLAVCQITIAHRITKLGHFIHQVFIEMFHGGLTLGAMSVSWVCWETQWTFHFPPLVPAPRKCRNKPPVTITSGLLLRCSYFYTPVSFTYNLLNMVNSRTYL